MKTNWILAGIVGLTLAGMTPNVHAQSRDRDRDREVSRRNEEGERLTFQNLPGEVKQTVGSEIGQDRVTDVHRITRNGRTAYRMEVEGAGRARTIMVDENGRLIRDQNDTEEGRYRTDYDTLPGDVKNGLQKESNGEKISKVWQVTRDRNTYYVAEMNDGHRIWVDDNGRTMKSDHDRLDRGWDSIRERTRDNDRRDNDRRDNNRDSNRRDADRRDNNDRDGRKVDFNDLPAPARNAIRNARNGRDVKGIREVRRDGRTVYEVNMENGRDLRVSEEGRILNDEK